MKRSILTITILFLITVNCLFSAGSVTKKEAIIKAYTFFVNHKLGNVEEQEVYLDKVFNKEQWLVKFYIRDNNSIPQKPIIIGVNKISGECKIEEKIKK